GVGIAGYVAITRETVNITDAYNDPRFNPENDKRTGYKTKSILCMPVYNSLGDILGVIQVLNKLTADHFTSEDENLLGAYASLAGISIANAQAYDELQKERDLLEVRVKERTKDLEEARKKSDELLLNILPYEIAEELKQSGAVVPKKYELVTVLFTDFKGFTLAAEKMSPERIVAELDNCFRYFDEIALKYNLEKIKTIGDAFMCAGGVPNKNISNPVDAVLAAIEIKMFMKEQADKKARLGEPFWEIRIGLHSGPLVAGVVGKKKFAYDVWGDTVNTASRMESSGEAGKINISQTTYELVKDFFECEYRGKVPAKNKGTIDMYFVHGIHKSLSANKKGLSPNKKFWKLYSEKFNSPPPQGLIS
ncbi:MAG: GAF domain-containing protein, partial [Leptospiraceae bacterium]|nr:GAF domain-containing protein [Leptospiraceae bacterium]